MQLQAVNCFIVVNLHISGLHLKLSKSWTSILRMWYMFGAMLGVTIVTVFVIVIAIMLMIVIVFAILFVNVPAVAVVTTCDCLRSCNVFQFPELNDFVSLFGRTDDRGIICDQRGIFRVNCMDCLDRTNVVQAALARHIMEQQVN